MAQQKYNIAYKQETEQLKLVSNLHDMTQRTMYQFTEFLMSSMSPVEYAKALPLPSFATMCKKYRLRHVEAFHLCRPISREALLSKWRKENKFEKWDPLSKSNLKLMKELMTEEIQLSPELYSTFWTLSIEDVDFPETKYKDAIEKLRKEIDTETKAKTSLTSRSEIRDSTKKIAKAESTLTSLREEMKAQRSSFGVVRRGLERKC
jgi:THO complex subunit 2